MAYRLKLPIASNVHPVSHVSFLKREVVTQTTNVALPEELTLEEADLLLPHKVLAQRSIRQHGELVKQVLIHWQNKPAKEASWEEELVIKSRFPAFSLEGKTVFDRGSSDKERAKGGEEGKTSLEPKQDQPIWHVYSRSKRGTRGDSKRAS